MNAQEIEEGLAQLQNGFMKPVIEEGFYYTVETTCGNEVVPCSVVGRYDQIAVESLRDYLEGKPLIEDDVVLSDGGWLARMSAPGYMDCTEWCAFDTYEEAAEYLIDTYGDES